MHNRDAYLNPDAAGTLHFPGFDTDAGKLRKALEPYITAGHRIGRTPAAVRSAPSGRTAAAAGPSSREHNQAIREWAARNGYPVSDRGRVPPSVAEAFNQAHSG